MTFSYSRVSSKSYILRHFDEIWLCWLWGLHNSWTGPTLPVVVRLWSGIEECGERGPSEETNFDRFYDSLIWCLLCRICPLSASRPLSPARSRWPNLDWRQMKTELNRVSLCICEEVSRALLPDIPSCKLHNITKPVNSNLCWESSLHVYVPMLPRLSALRA